MGVVHPPRQRNCTTDHSDQQLPALKSHFGKIMLRLRQSAKLTQRELADRAHLTQQAISNLETGRCEPTWGTVCRLAQALNTEPTAFLGKQTK
ncbi:MAG: helix-turn-helix domain-containing protein [Planctomycetes bacterium]|nr:helix-turn-helix domain-containing protein [Planctomycetota bacterium]